jgi:5-(carboxyamino)imidazole ribonucleotide synthase
MTRVAVLGGGQLGRMLGLAGIPLGVECRFLDPSPDAPAAAIGSVVSAGLDDLTAAEAVADGAEVVTYEWEGVPAPVAYSLAGQHRVRPGPRALEVSQDRLAEKSLCADLAIAVPAHVAVDDRAGLDAAIAELGLPCVLKTRRGGYDGKGQLVLTVDANLDAAWGELGGGLLIVETLVPFIRELSILAVRAADGATACWPVVENVHREGILRLSRAPAPDLTPQLQALAEKVATALLEELDYVGVLAVELFETPSGLLVNELAPRVHNSGHWTIEGAVTSQFENHLRAVLDLPLGATDAVGVSAMLNCIGTLPDAAAVLGVDGAHLHLYGKEPRPGRKLGHITVTARDAAELERRLASLQDRVGAAFVT